MAKGIRISATVQPFLVGSHLLFYLLLLLLPTITVHLELERHVLAPARRNPYYGFWEGRNMAAEAAPACKQSKS